MNPRLRLEAQEKNPETLKTLNRLGEIPVPIDEAASQLLHAARGQRLKPGLPKKLDEFGACTSSTNVV